MMSFSTKSGDKLQTGKSRRVSEQGAKIFSLKNGLIEKIRRTKSVPDELTSLENPKKSTVYEINRKKGKPERMRASRASSSAHVQYVLLRTVILDNDTAQLRSLIARQDIKINYMDPDGLLPIHYAAKAGEVSVIAILTKAGADINAVSRNGEYPLDFAVKEGNFDVARYLIENGAKQNSIIDGFFSNKRSRAGTSTSSSHHK